MHRLPPLFPSSPPLLSSSRRGLRARPLSAEADLATRRVRWRCKSGEEAMASSASYSSPMTRRSSTPCPMLVCVLLEISRRFLIRHSLLSEQLGLRGGQEGVSIRPRHAAYSSLCSSAPVPEMHTCGTPRLTLAKASLYKREQRTRSALTATACFVRPSVVFHLLLCGVAAWLQRAAHEHA